MNEFFLLKTCFSVVKCFKYLEKQSEVYDGQPGVHQPALSTLPALPCTHLFPFAVVGHANAFIISVSFRDLTSYTQLKGPRGALSLPLLPQREPLP